MKILNKPLENSFLIKAIFKGENQKNIIKNYWIYDNPLTNKSEIYINKEKASVDIKTIEKAIETILSSKERSYQIDVKSFLTKKISEKRLIKKIIYLNERLNGKRFSLKTLNDDQENNISHSIYSSMKENDFFEELLLSSTINSIKKLQDMPPNILTIDYFSEYATNLLKQNKKIKFTILNEKDLIKNNMNLILGVNQGSNRKAKVIVAEYKGNPISKNNLSLIGKGIIFDSGGYNLKTGRHMNDMKFDMSGAAIALHTIDAIAKLKIKKNFSIVIPLTDNLLDSNAQVPETILKSMNGMTVEIANTDAEGRLVLADGITYAIRKLKATKIIDISTLTGTVLYALGKYTGVWTSNDNDWNVFNECAKKEDELVWRMPLDDLYIESLSKATHADILSCSNKEYPDSNIAAAWLNKFTENKDYIHLDIAGSADKDSEGQAPMLRTLIQFIKEI